MKWVAVLPLMILLLAVAAGCDDEPEFVRGYNDGCKGILENFADRMASDGLIDNFLYGADMNTCSDLSSMFGGSKVEQPYLAGFREGCREGVNLLTGGLGEMRGVDAPFSEQEAAQADAICDENQEGSEYTYLPRP